MKPEKSPKPIKKTIKKRSKKAYDVSDEALAKAEQQIGELTAHLQRLQADFENYKKRVADERAELMDSAKEAVLIDLLPALDNFDRAATHLPTELEENNWARGMQYVGQQLIDILDEMGVQKISPIGEKFNHSHHEAIEYISSKKPEGTIIEVVVPSYQIKDKIVRPAQVKVSSGSSKKT